MKFAETPVQNNNFIYLKERLMEGLGLSPSDKLEWHVVEGPCKLEIPKGEKLWMVRKKENQTVTVKKKEGA